MKHTKTSNAIGSVLGLSALLATCTMIVADQDGPEPEPAVAVAAAPAPEPAPAPDPLPEITKPPVQIGLGYLSARLYENEHATMEALRGAEIVVNAEYDRAIRMSDHYALKLYSSLNGATAVADMRSTEDAAVGALQTGQVMTVRCRGIGPGWDGIYLKDCIVEGEE